MSSSAIGVIGISAFERPDPSLVLALCRAGATGVLDLGRDPERARSALARLARELPNAFGVRVPEGAEAEPSWLPENARIVILPAGADVKRWLPREVFVQVSSLAEARAAIRDGAAGVIAKGNESGGRVGDLTTFVLLQRLLDADFDVPVFAQGGIGQCTAAACAAAGAAGVVLDSQLALVSESTLPAAVKSAVASMDGSETTIIGGHRLYTRPDLPVANIIQGSDDEVLPLLGGDDLEHNLIPAGQDAAFASTFAERFRTAGGVVHGLRKAVAMHLDKAHECRPLDVGSPLAAAHGIDYPVFQGPMSRVSDRAAFAEAVARAGGLPFLALALMSGDEVRKLLRETVSLLGDRPWGVGILGFVPAALRKEQLEVLREFRPPVALIAGGRPTQAKPLEAQGTATYLHAPAPGLLDLFVKQGARRFVFEGRECGGHVGPRTSFVLWETQLERLRALGDGEVAELHLLFAGGIHDARSAAMVAAMAAPLAARGARIGVLMGTAYLFTREAVETGAILGGFQRAALECERTVLLETAPGHATRCVASEYVRTFHAEKVRLEGEGVEPKEVWRALEQLNLGRLRIASRGLRREDGVLVGVGEEEQVREGMFMIGDVAALRDRVCSMEELHREVTEGATAHLEALEMPTEEATGVRVADIAIVGMACTFPGAPDLSAYWSNVLNARSLITEVPRERWNAGLFYDENATGASAGEMTPSKWGGFLPPMVFDPLAFGIPPRSLAAIEPVQLLSLEIARRALIDAGYSDGMSSDGREFDRERTAVIFGAEAGTELAGAYGFRATYRQLAGALPRELDERLPTLTEDSFPGILANVITGRIANRLDLGGPNFTVDAACASSLSALDLSLKELVAGTSDMVLCGGADLHNSANDYLLFSSVHALSTRDHCRVFDAESDGTLLGEGIGCVVLKRLQDAERDGDHVYAVVKGVGASSDGRSLGLTAPRKEGQKRALERAYKRAGMSPAEIGMVEAHGTGTVVGDKTELSTLDEVYRAAGAAPGSCTLGSVKSQIGHTKCAAGMAGLIKTALSLHYGVRPPTLHIQKPNPAYDAERSPFGFSGTARPWPDEHRNAALSALGFGGANFHAVLSAHDAEALPDCACDDWPAELFLFRGEDRDAAAAEISRLAELLSSDADFRLRDLACTVAATGRGAVQLALVARDVADLRDKLGAARTFAADGKTIFAATEDRAGSHSKVAFLFPGQGSQYPGMLADLFVSFPRLQRYLRLGRELVPYIFPPDAFTREARKAQADQLTDTRVAQPALGMVDLAMANLLTSVGVRADMTGGHSYGELVALCFAGSFDESALVSVSGARARAILDAAGDDPGTMAAVSAPASDVEHVLRSTRRDDVVIANYNAPRQTVISGPTAAVEAAVADLGEAGLTARLIPVSCAFHSPVVAGARTALGERLNEVDFLPARVPVWSNATAAPYPTESDAARARLAAQVALPVRFAEQVEGMYEAGARLFVEAGPGRVLSGLVDKILGDRPHQAVPCAPKGEPGLASFLIALARLAVHGVPVDGAALFVGRRAETLDLSQPPARSKTAWVVDGQTAKPAVGDPPANAYRPVTEPIVIASSASAPAGQARSSGTALAPRRAPGAAASARASRAVAPVRSEVPLEERDGAVFEYLRNMRELVAAQRDVMLGYLGAAPAAYQEWPAEAAQVLDVGDEHDAPPPQEHLDPTPAPAPKENLSEVLLAIVSDRTGYPVEMLDLDLDLEAELSVDSIKRIEILGELNERVALSDAEGEAAEEVIEELAAIKTLRGIIDWIEAHRGSDESEEEAAAELPAVGRYLVRVLETAPPVTNGLSLHGRRFALTDDGRGVATRLAALLESHGATTEIVGADDELNNVDGLIFLSFLSEGAAPDTVKLLFVLARDAVLGGARWVISVTPNGGTFGQQVGDDFPSLYGGAAGLIKSIVHERPEVRARIVDVDPKADSAVTAEQLVAELLTTDDYLEVGYADGVRYRPQLVAGEPLVFADATVDDVDDGAAAEGVKLGAGTVVLVTGGARGITARVAVEMARRYGCHLELVGRSPLPRETETEDLEAAADAPSIRRALVQRGWKDPASIEGECARILAAREIRTTLADIEATGASARYHSVDVRDSVAFGALIDEVYATRGRIDGVVHGAGVIEDKLLHDKSQRSFARVFDTKVAAALTLAAKLRREARFVVFFGSISGVLGNRGQADYAAANEALDKLAWSLNRCLAGRVVSVDWGPWRGVGMVAKELEREYEKRGIGLIHPDAGVACLFDELERGSAADAQVVLACESPAIARALGLDAEDDASEEAAAEVEAAVSESGAGAGG